LPEEGSLSSGFFKGKYIMGYRSMFEVSIEYTEEYEKMAAGLNKSFFDYFLKTLLKYLSFLNHQ